MQGQTNKQERVHNEIVGWAGADPPAGTIMVRGE